MARHLLHPMKIRAGAKALARARENNGSYSFVAIERAERVGQLGNQRVVERIVEIRPIQYDDRDRVAQRDLEQRCPRGTACLCGFRCADFFGAHHHHIRNTPNVVLSLGRLREAEIASPSVRRVSAGSMTPSSHSRALA